jgi:four helix bundle protein
VVIRNYIEANEALSKKGSIMRINICRKEAKESRYWLRLIDVGKNNELHLIRQKLAGESQELMNIFGAILQKSQ